MTLHQHFRYRLYSRHVQYTCGCYKVFLAIPSVGSNVAIGADVHKVVDMLGGHEWDDHSIDQSYFLTWPISNKHTE